MLEFTEYWILNLVRDVDELKIYLYSFYGSDHKETHREGNKFI